MRVLQYLLLGAIGIAGLAIIVLVWVLVYAVEPVQFTWATDTSAESDRRFDEVVDGEIVAASLTPVCGPRLLDAPSISYGTIADFATQAVLAINSYDYLNWDQEIPEALNRYFTPAAARSYFAQFQRSRLLQTVQNNYYTVTALTVRPAIVTRSTDSRAGPREWEVQVPVTLYYQTGASTVQGGRTANQATEVFAVKVIEQPPNEQNFRGVGVVGFGTSTVRSMSDLEALR